MLRVQHPYQPPENVANVIRECVGELEVADSKSWLDIDLHKNPTLKYKLLVECERRFSTHHSVPNDRLHEMRTVRDVVKFYAQAMPNLNEYRQLARNTAQLPPNLTLLETPKLFHPDDKAELHGG